VELTDNENENARFEVAPAFAQYVQNIWWWPFLKLFFVFDGAAVCIPFRPRSPLLKAAAGLVDVGTRLHPAAAAAAAAEPAEVEVAGGQPQSGRPRPEPS